jgi:hypothetical protein
MKTPTAMKIEHDLNGLYPVAAAAAHEKLEKDQEL